MNKYILMSAKVFKCRAVILNNVHQLRYSSQKATDEVDKFSKIKDWWNDPETKALKEMNELRVPLIVDYLTGKKQTTGQLPLKGYKLLDVGSGGGLLSEPLARLGGQVTGIEPNSDCVNYCNKRLNGPSTDLKANLKYIMSTIEQLKSKEKKAQFDAVIASEVLEHVEDVESVIKSAYELLKPNGFFFVTTINKTVSAYLTAILVAENITHNIPKGTHHYDMLVPTLHLKQMLEKNNFDVKLMRGFMYNPFTHKWFWTTNTQVFYAVVAQKSNKMHQDV